MKHGDHSQGTVGFVWILSLVMGCTAAMSCSVAAAVPAATQSLSGLGKATFATSTQNSAAQTAFLRGLLLLHVFEYRDAAQAFREAERLDPKLAIAYWGEAMTFNHPVWNEVDPVAGQAALRKLAPTPEERAAVAADARERGLLVAVEILYDGKGTKRERDARYLAAMEKLAMAYRGDDEAQLFYALALLGKSEGVRETGGYLKAAGIAQEAYRRNPQHPGAAHYWIHGMDDPQHAKGALEAARSLSKIAPDAGHAQHMCSHIFMALGMWQDVVEANENADRVVDEQSRAAGRPVLTCGHYVSWLEYAYLQQGRRQDAAKLFEACRKTGQTVVAWSEAHPSESMSVRTQGIRRQVANSLISMRATEVIESQRWDGTTMAMSPDAASGDSMIGWDVFTSGYAAAERKDADLAEESLKKLKTVAEGARADGSSSTERADYLDVLAGELGGLIASVRGDRQGALLQVRQATSRYEAMAFDFGPPATVKPPEELLGELLLAYGEPKAAAQAFTASLKRAPGRALSLLGLARAQTAAGEKAAARATYQELLGNWRLADAGLPELSEVRRGAGRS